MPPICSRSISATVAPSSRARRAAVTPAGPPPITTTSNTVRLPLTSFPSVRRRPQPQRDVLGLHSLPYHRDQLTTQPVEVSLLAQSSGERPERPGRVVLAPVEAPVYKRLDAAAQRIEKPRHNEGRGDHSERGLLAGDANEHPLQHDDAA